MIQLDTSFLIRALSSGTPEDRALRKWLKAGDSIGLSAIAWTEFQCGPVSVMAVEMARRLMGDPLPFTAEEASTAARLFNETGRRRGTLLDCMIASSAIIAGDSLATANRRDFDRFVSHGLILDP